MHTIFATVQDSNLLIYKQSNNAIAFWSLHYFQAQKVQSKHHQNEHVAHLVLFLDEQIVSLCRFIVTVGD